MTTIHTLFEGTHSEALTAQMAAASVELADALATVSQRGVETVATMTKVVQVDGESTTLVVGDVTMIGVDTETVLTVACAMYKAWAERNWS